MVGWRAVLGLETRVRAILGLKVFPNQPEKEFFRLDFLILRDNVFLASVVEKPLENLGFNEPLLTTLAQDSPSGFL